MPKFVCTLTDVEGPEVADALAIACPDLVPLPAPTPGPWRRAGRVGHRVLPHESDTDGMYLARLRKG